MGSGINRHMLHNGVRDTQRDAAQWGQAYTGICCTIGSGLHRQMLHNGVRATQADAAQWVRATQAYAAQMYTGNDTDHRNTVCCLWN